MLSNHLKIAFRKLASQKLITFIHLFGLATAIASCFLITLFVKDEVGFDRFHTKKEYIFRAVREHTFNGESQISALTNGALASALSSNFKEIETSTRLLLKKGVVSLENQAESFADQQLAFADSNFLTVFDFTLAKGNVRDALSKPGTIILSKQTAQRYYGDADPINKTLVVDNQHSFQVVGVLDAIPTNSHIHFDALASMATLYSSTPWLNEWRRNSIYTYVVLDDPASVVTLNAEMPNLVEKYIGKEARQNVNYYFQPLLSIHHDTNVVSNAEPARSKKVIYIFACVGLFILILGCINYVNLSTAYSMTRAKEIGVRKTLGAKGNALISQFLQESVLVAIISVVLALLLTTLTLPFFNDLLGRNIPLWSSIDTTITILALSLIIIVVVGIIAGSYPAFYLTRFHPALTLKGKLLQSSKGFSFRKALVVFQFSVTIMLISSTFIIQHQLKFMSGSNLGFDQHNLIQIPLRDPLLIRQQESIKQSFLRSTPGITGITSADNLLDFTSRVNARLLGSSDENEVLLSRISCDFNFLKTVKLKLLAGRDFSLQNPADSLDAIIINAQAVKKYGWNTPQDALGHELEGVRFGANRKSKIIGVVEDFNFAPMYSEIEPLLIVCEPGEIRHLIIRLAPESVSESLASIKNTWQNISGIWPFTFDFVDDKIATFYQNDARLEKLFNTFVVLSICISCLGLLGLVIFTSERKAKEFGIRKILGADMSSIMGLLVREFMILIIIANVIAWPTAWWLMSKWLEGFAYRISIEWYIFLLAGGIALLIALLTLSFQIIRSASTNPLKVLKSE